MPPLSLIICASPRSGSYFLSDLLNRCGLPFGDEWLTPFHQGSRKWQYGVPDSLPYLDYLKLLSRKERHEGRFALKVMYPQFRELRSALEGMEMPAGTRFRDRMEAVFPNPRFIYLTRGDTLAQAISHLKARQTRQWVKRSGNREQAKINPVYSFIGIAQQLEERERNDQLWRSLFEYEELDCFPVVFEELQRKPQAMMEQLLAWLGLEMPDTGLENEKSRFTRMATQVNDEWKERFRRDQASCAGKPLPRPASALADLRIRSVSLGEQYPLGGECRFRVEVENTGAEALDPRGAPDGKGWLRVVGSLKGPGIEEWFQQELRSSGDAGLLADCLLPPPACAGRAVLKLALAEKTLGHETVEAECGWSRAVEFIHTGPKAESRALFSGLRDMSNGWQYLPWFGCFLDDKFPWIYHADHEWLYIKPRLEEGGVYHVLDANLGWLEIDPRTYPALRSLEKGESWRFLQRDKGTRTFRDEASGREFTAETNRPEHLRKFNSSGSGEQA